MPTGKRRCVAVVWHKGIRKHERCSFRAQRGRQFCGLHPAKRRRRTSVAEPVTRLGSDVETIDVLRKHIARLRTTCEKTSFLLMSLRSAVIAVQKAESAETRMLSDCAAALDAAVAEQVFA